MKGSIETQGNSVQKQITEIITDGQTKEVSGREACFAHIIPWLGL